jgi:cyclophilin family peptidyl-prolyl cis-trans isomerase
VLAQLQSDYPEDVQIVYRHLPLIGTPDNIFHDKAALSTQAAQAAGNQGKFWEMHDLLFENQDAWVNMSVEDFQTWLLEQAPALDLDADQFAADMTSADNVAFAQEAWDHANETGLAYTPLILVNRQLWPNNLPISYENLAAIVELQLLESRMFTACPGMTIDQSKQYFATVETEKGSFVIELYDDIAPVAVNSFIFLAQQDWYDGVTFHRVLPGFVAQGGDPSGTGYGGPGYAYSIETTPDLTFDRAGLVAMANSGPDSNGSQFFITYAAQPRLNNGYTIFGEVVEGMDVVESLAPRDPAQNTGLPPGDKILDVTIEER